MSFFDFKVGKPCYTRDSYHSFSVIIGCGCVFIIRNKMTSATFKPISQP